MLLGQGKTILLAVALWAVTQIAPSYGHKYCWQDSFTADSLDVLLNQVPVELHPAECSTACVEPCLCVVRISIDASVYNLTYACHSATAMLADDSPYLNCAKPPQATYYTTPTKTLIGCCEQSTCTSIEEYKARPFIQKFSGHVYENDYSTQPQNNRNNDQIPSVTSSLRSTTPSDDTISDLIIALIGGFFLIVFAVSIFAVVFYVLRRRQKAKQKAVDKQTEQQQLEVERQRLKALKQLERESDSARSLLQEYKDNPVVYIDEGSTTTTTVNTTSTMTSTHNTDQGAKVQRNSSVGRSSGRSSSSSSSGQTKFKQRPRKL